jgi:Regulatory subunit of type II PKA R-subunit
MSFEIPAGLTTMLQDFTVSVLRNRPPDLVKFANDYFRSLYEKQASNVVSNSSQVCKQATTLSFTGTASESSSSSMGPSPGKISHQNLRCLAYMN